MKEFFEFRINYEFSHLLFDSDEGRDLGEVSKSVKVVTIASDDPRFRQIPAVSKEIREKYGKPFLFSWRVRRSYTKSELESACLFHLIISTVFEPTGEECGTIYDESAACKICGAKVTQNGPLKLKKGPPNKPDIARTIGGEVIVSERLVSKLQSRRLAVFSCAPVIISERENKYFQPTAITEIGLSELTIAGIDPFDLSESSEAYKAAVSGNHKFNFDKEVYKCPLGHTIGLNLISEAHIIRSSIPVNCDFFVSKQRIGVRRGLLRPEPLYFCSPAVRKMVIDEKLRGFKFEVARVEPK